MHRIDSYGATVEGTFTEEVPEQGIPATDVSAAWLTAVQEEFCSVIEAAGIVLDKNSNSQLLEALQALTPSGVPVTVVADTLLSSHGKVLVNPAAGETIIITLPAYDTVFAGKEFRVKNIGVGTAQITAADGKTIDNEATIDLAPRDRALISKDGANWQLF